MGKAKILVWVNPDLKKYLMKKAIDKDKCLLDLSPSDIDFNIPIINYTKPIKPKPKFNFRI